MGNKSTFSNFLWRFFERCGAQGVSLIVTIILARLLDPNVYGIIAIVIVIINFFQIFVDSGLGTSLIQNKDADDIDFSSVFYVKILTSIIIYLVLYFVAPFIALFYSMEELTNVIRVLGVSVLIASVKNIEQSYVSRNMLFKCFFYSTIIGTIISAVIGIIMAYTGFGVWALVAQTLSNDLIDTVVLWITVKWRPKNIFSFSRLKKLFSFGWKVFIASLLDNIYENIRQLIIGKQYTSADLAFYNKGKQFPSVIVVNLSASLDSVLLPTMANTQEKIYKVKDLVRKSIIVSSYLLVPLMFGMFACSEAFINVVLTSKWSDSIFFMQMFCLSFSTYAINSAFQNGIKAIGKSNVFLITEIIKKVIGFSIIIFTLFFDLRIIALGFFVGSVFNILVNIIPSKKFLFYSLKEQFIDIIPTFFLSLTMLLVIYPINFLKISYCIKLIIMIPAGCIFYILGSALFKMKGFYYYLDLFKNKFKKKSI